MTTKTDLATRIAAGHGISQASAESIVTSVFSEIAGALQSGGEVSIYGFGTFVTKDRPATTGRHPRTGEAIEIAARKVVRFRAGKGLSGKVNG